MDPVGTKVGPIRILEQLGAGGMGQIYVGYHEKLKRKVALKAIRSQKRGDQRFRKRMLREAQILSQLNHPNICQIYDLIELEQQHYIVLELIKGENLDVTDLSFQDKLSIAEQLAQVLVTTHNKGIIHRDLKPENIMVTPEKEIKVLDFGLSSTMFDQESHGMSIDQYDPSHSEEDVKLTIERLTKMGAIVGTLKYMSPEQARGKPPNAASDMYSFGLILQELFTGHPPYPAGLGYDKLLFRVLTGNTREVEGLERGLTQLINRLKSAQWDTRPTAVEVAEHLEWIRTGPRRQALRIATVAFIAMLILGITGTSYGIVKARQQTRRANQAEQIAQKEARIAKQTTVLLQDVFTSVEPEKQGKDVRVTELIESFEAKLVSLDIEPEIRGTLLHTLGSAYFSLGQYDQARDRLQSALAIRREQLGSTSSETLATLFALGTTLNRSGKLEEAESILTSVLTQRQDALGGDHPLTLEAMNQLADTLWNRGQYEKAEELMREGLQISREILGDDHEQTLNAMSELSSALRALSKYREAESICEETSRRMRRVLGPRHTKTLKIQNVLGNILWDLGKYQAAELAQRVAWEGQIERLGAEHPDTLRSMFYVTMALREQGRYEEAESMTRDLIGRLDRVFGLQHPLALMSTGSLGLILTHRNHFDEGERLCRRAVDDTNRILGPDHPIHSIANNMLGLALLEAGHLEEAGQVFESLIDAYDLNLSSRHPLRLKAISDLASILLKKGQHERANELIRDVVDQQQEILGENHPWTVASQRIQSQASTLSTDASNP